MSIDQDTGLKPLCSVRAAHQAARRSQNPRRCFEDEAEGKYLVPLRESAALFDKATDDSNTMARKVAEVVEATDRRIERLSDRLSELEADWREAMAENAALQDENAQLRAELDELRKSRTTR
jgi:chromosome segregation ATPase